ncbi:hypothetical protein BC832DRAFT_184066 [Gaertneriomyces semiglobifer]|nr:hypothetical protein BC832DRAFT_184066 [Gaertneriomyces semiglobifer]
MPPKRSKAAKKAKSGGKSRGKRKAKSAKGPKMSKEEGSAFLAFVMVETRKQSILLYRTKYLELRDELKRNRSQLQAVERDRYGAMRSLVDTITSMQDKLLTMHIEKADFAKTLDLNVDKKILRQRETIQGMALTGDWVNSHAALPHALAIVELQETLMQRSDHLTQLINEQTALLLLDPAALEDEIERLKLHHTDLLSRHEKELEMIQEKHDRLISVITEHAEKVLVGVEGKACLAELDSMDTKSVSTLQTNERLRHRLEAVEEEHRRVATVVEAMEQQLVKLRREHGSVDWNLMLGLPENQDSEANWIDIADDEDEVLEWVESLNINDEVEAAGADWLVEEMIPLGMSTGASGKHHATMSLTSYDLSAAAVDGVTQRCLSPVRSAIGLTISDVLHKQSTYRCAQNGMFGLEVAGEGMALKPPDVRDWVMRVAFEEITAGSRA